MHASILSQKNPVDRRNLDNVKFNLVQREPDSLLNFHWCKRQDRRDKK